MLRCAGVGGGGGMGVIELTQYTPAPIILGFGGGESLAILMLPIKLVK